MFVLIPIPCRFGIFCCLILSSWVPLGIQLSPLSVISFSIRPLRKHAWAWAIPFVNNKTLTAPQLKAPQQTPGKMLDSEKPEPPGYPLRSSTFGLCPVSYFSHQWGQWPGRATYKKKDFFFFLLIVWGDTVHYGRERVAEGGAICAGWNRLFKFQKKRK